LHDNDVIHRDIKSANLLVDEFGNVFLADFGCSKKIQNVAEKTAEITGTPNYVAPEVIQDQLYTKAADIWSLGCTVLEMLAHKPPWHHVFHKFDNPMSLMHYIMSSDDSLQIPTDLNPDAKDFLRLCLQRNPNYRATAYDLLEHPFVTAKSEAVSVPDRTETETESTQDEATVEQTANDGLTFDHIGDEEFSDSESDDDDDNNVALEALDIDAITMDVRQSADQPDDFKNYYEVKKEEKKPIEGERVKAKFSTISGSSASSFTFRDSVNSGRFSIRRESSDDGLLKADESQLRKYLSKNVKEQKTCFNLSKLVEAEKQ
jgi:serine/threonine protein kinase